MFPAVHPAVGNLEIYDDGNELTLVAGNFTHGHFSNYDENLSVDQKESAIVDAVVSFLEDLFADRVVLWGHKSVVADGIISNAKMSLKSTRGSSFGPALDSEMSDKHFR